MRRPPELILLSKVVAFSFFCRGLSADHVADLLSVNRRTVFKWSQADCWKERMTLLAPFFALHPLSVEHVLKLVIAYAEADKPHVVCMNQPVPEPKFFDPWLLALAHRGAKSWQTLLLKKFLHLL